MRLYVGYSEIFDFVGTTRRLRRHFFAHGCSFSGAIPVTSAVCATWR